MKRKSFDETAAPVVTPRVLLPWMLAMALALLAWIAVDRQVLHTSVLTSFQGLEPLSPLYAFWMPVFRPAAFLFVLLALSWAFWLPRLISSRISELWVAASAAAAAPVSDSAVVLMMSAGWVQTFAMETFLFTLW
jgi:hypothetical protein